jgi:hypothetical protein
MNAGNVGTSIAIIVITTAISPPVIVARWMFAHGVIAIATTTNFSIVLHANAKDAKRCKQRRMDCMTSFLTSFAGSFLGSILGSLIVWGGAYLLYRRNEE